ARPVLSRRRALQRKPAVLLRAGARAGSEDLRADARPARPAAGGAEGVRAAGGSLAAGSRQGVHRLVEVPEVRTHGRGAVQAGIAADQREEGRPGARVLPPPDKGLPELEV